MSYYDTFKLAPNVHPTLHHYAKYVKCPFQSLMIKHQQIPFIRRLLHIRHCAKNSMNTHLIISAHHVILSWEMTLV